MSLKVSQLELKASLKKEKKITEIETFHTPRPTRVKKYNQKLGGMNCVSKEAVLRVVAGGLGSWLLLLFFLL